MRRTGYRPTLQLSAAFCFGLVTSELREPRTVCVGGYGVVPELEPDQSSRCMCPTADKVTCNNKTTTYSRESDDWMLIQS